MCLFAFVSRPPPGEILPASAFSVCNMTGGGRLSPSDLVTLMSRPRLSRRCCLGATAPYLLIRGAGAQTPPASSPPPDSLTNAHTHAQRKCLHFYDAIWVSVLSDLYMVLAFFHYYFRVFFLHWVLYTFHLVLIFTGCWIRKWF